MRPCVGESARLGSTSLARRRDSGRERDWRVPVQGGELEQQLKDDVEDRSAWRGKQGLSILSGGKELKRDL